MGGKRGDSNSSRSGSKQAIFTLFVAYHDSRGILKLLHHFRPMTVCHERCCASSGHTQIQYDFPDSPLFRCTLAAAAIVVMANVAVTAAASLTTAVATAAARAVAAAVA